MSAFDPLRTFRAKSLVLIARCTPPIYSTSWRRLRQDPGLSLQLGRGAVVSKRPDPYIPKPEPFFLELAGEYEVIAGKTVDLDPDDPEYQSAVADRLAELARRQREWKR